MSCKVPLYTLAEELANGRLVLEAVYRSTNSHRPFAKASGLSVELKTGTTEWKLVTSVA